MEAPSSARSRKRTGRKVNGTRQNLKFPEKYHLNVTTEKRVHAWYSSGVREAFASRDGGIVTTREAKDGSGILAIADSQIVLLHDAKGHTNKRYKLKGSDGQVRLIDFANDSKEIFFSTSLQDSVLRYSITKDRLINFSCTHPSPPTILAVSPQSVYLVSASRKPPVLYLQELPSGGAPVHIKPQASDAYVTAAAFHPQRENNFLLAYADSTLSVHDASRIISNRANGSDGSMGHFQRGHRTTNAQIGDSKAKRVSATPGARVIGITAASFIPGHSLRVVSVAGDGKCRIVDFEFGLKVLRTWHVHAACTCLSVFTTAETRQKSYETVLETKSEGDVKGKPAEGRLYGHIIAIGRADGFVVLYDDLGLMRGERLLHLKRGPIINVEWIPNEKQGLLELDCALGMVNSVHATEVINVPARRAGCAAKSEADLDRKQFATPQEHIAPRTDAQSSYSATSGKIPGATAKTDKTNTAPPPTGSLLDLLKRSPMKIPPRKQPTTPVIPLPLPKILSMYFPMPGAWISSSSSLGMMQSIPSVELIASQLPRHEMLEQTTTSQVETQLLATEKSSEKPKMQEAVHTRGSVSVDLPRVSQVPHHDTAHNVKVGNDDGKQLYSITPIQPTHASNHLHDSPVLKSRREVTANRPFEDAMHLTKNETETSTKPSRAKGKGPMPLCRPSSPSQAQQHPHFDIGFEWLPAPQKQIPRTAFRSHHMTPELVNSMFISPPSSPPHPVCTPTRKDSLPEKRPSPKFQLTPSVRPTGHTPRRSSDTLPRPQPQHDIEIDPDRRPKPSKLHKSKPRPRKAPTLEASTPFHKPHPPSTPSSSLTTWSQEGTVNHSLDADSTACPPQPPSPLPQRAGHYSAAAAAAAPPSPPKWLPRQWKPLPSPPSPVKPIDAMARQKRGHKAGCGCGCAEVVRGELAKVKEEIETLKEVVVGLRREILMFGGKSGAEEVATNTSVVKAGMKLRKGGGGESGGNTEGLVAGLRREVERYGRIVEELTEVNGRG